MFKSFANKGFATGALNKLAAKHSIEDTTGMLYMADVEGTMKWGFDINEAGAPYIKPEEPVQTPEPSVQSTNAFGAMGTTMNPFAQLMTTPKTAPEPRTGGASGYKIEKDRPEQNGIKRPSEGTVCRDIWDTLDRMSADLPGTEVVRVKEWKAEAMQKGIDPTTATIQYYRWRQFNGVAGRQK